MEEMFEELSRISFNCDDQDTFTERGHIKKWENMDFFSNLADQPPPQKFYQQLEKGVKVFLPCMTIRQGMQC